MIQYNNEDKSRNKKGWVISTAQLSKIKEDIFEYEGDVSMEQIEAILLSLYGEIELLVK